MPCWFCQIEPKTQTQSIELLSFLQCILQLPMCQLWQNNLSLLVGLKRSLNTGPIKHQLFIATVYNIICTNRFWVSLTDVLKRECFNKNVAKNTQRAHLYDTDFTEAACKAAELTQNFPFKYKVLPHTPSEACTIRIYLGKMFSRVGLLSARWFNLTIVSCQFYLIVCNNVFWHFKEERYTKPIHSW